MGCNQPASSVRYPPLGGFSGGLSDVGPGRPAAGCDLRRAPGKPSPCWQPSGRAKRRLRATVCAEAPSPQRLFPADSACSRQPAGRTSFLYNPSLFCRQDADSTWPAADGRRRKALQPLHRRAVREAELGHDDALLIQYGHSVMVSGPLHTGEVRRFIPTFHLRPFRGGRRLAACRRRPPPDTETLARCGSLPGWPGRTRRHR